MKILWVANITDLIGLVFFGLLALFVGIVFLIANFQDKLKKDNKKDKRKIR